jgi:hypothetical protein
MALIENIKALQNKIANAQRRFRQGRITYERLQSLVQTYKQDAHFLLTKNANDLNVKKPEEHIHGENCSHHDDDVVEMPEKF